MKLRLSSNNSWEALCVLRQADLRNSYRPHESRLGRSGIVLRAMTRHVGNSCPVRSLPVFSRYMPRRLCRLQVDRRNFLPADHDVQPCADCEQTFQRYE